MIDDTFNFILGGLMGWVIVSLISLRSDVGKIKKRLDDRGK